LNETANTSTEQLGNRIAELRAHVREHHTPRKVQVGARKTVDGKPLERPVIRRPSSRNPDFYEVLVRPGNYLFREGDPADHLYVVISGSIEIRLDSSNFLIATLGDGECFGEQAMLYQGRRGASAYAREQAICLEITTEILAKAIESQPTLVQKALRAMMLQLIHRNEMRKIVREKGASPCELNFPAESPAGSLFQRIAKDKSLSTVVVPSNAALKTMLSNHQGLIVSAGSLSITRGSHTFLCGEGMTIGVAEAVAREQVVEAYNITSSLNGWVIDGPQAFKYFERMPSGLFGICRGIIARTLDLEVVPNWQRDYL
jgi:CRP-like cAMP-binding protein